MNVNVLSEIEQARFNMVEQQVRTWLVLDPDVLQALFDVPRERYVPAAMQSLAFSDIEIPLIIDAVDTHETMLTPKLEARLAQELLLQPTDCVLEIGTGSGYQTAILAQLVERVYSIERIQPLLDKAKARAKLLNLNNIQFRHSDGGMGWAERGPFDAILSAAAPRFIPEELKQQLAIGGRLVIPVGDAKQQLMVVDRTGDGFIETAIEPVRFVPLVAGRLI